MGGEEALLRSHQPEDLQLCPLPKGAAFLPQLPFFGLCLKIEAVDISNKLRPTYNLC